MLDFIIIIALVVAFSFGLFYLAGGDFWETWNTFANLPLKQQLFMVAITVALLGLTIMALDDGPSRGGRGRKK